VFIESVFSWPGIGLLTFEAIRSRDLPVLQGVFLLFTALVVLGNLLADLSYGRIDPRVQKGV
jgi:peptide/nickel transport system permease protein